MSEQVFRKLIEVEIRLGFLAIPTKDIELFPSDKSQVILRLDGTDMPLSYNPEHRRVFGLTAWYRKHNAKPGDLVILTKYENVYTAIIKDQSPKSEKQEEKEAEELIDLSGLSSHAKGDIVEDRIKELVLLHGQGLLNVYKPVIDTEGIDLIIVRNGQFHPIFIQSKSRFNLNERSMILRIKVKTFNPHSNYYLVGAFFNPKTLELDDNVLLIPSKEVVKAGKVKSANGEYYNITTSLDKSSNGMWSKYLIKKSELANKLMEKFEEMNEYYK